MRPGYEISKTVIGRCQKAEVPNHVCLQKRSVAIGAWMKDPERAIAGRAAIAGTATPNHDNRVILVSHRDSVRIEQVRLVGPADLTVTRVGSYFRKDSQGDIDTFSFCLGPAGPF